MKLSLILSTASVLVLAGCNATEPVTDHTGMTMDDMSHALHGKTGDAFDAAFIEGMIPHHQGAIDMANAALQNAGHEEIKDMARDIIESQQREIDMMKEWQREWGFSE